MDSPNAGVTSGGSSVAFCQNLFITCSHILLICLKIRQIINFDVARYTFVLSFYRILSIVWRSSSSHLRKSMLCSQYFSTLFCRELCLAVTIYYNQMIIHAL